MRESPNHLARGDEDSMQTLGTKERIQANLARQVMVTVTGEDSNANTAGADSFPGLDAVTTLTTLPRPRTIVSPSLDVAKTILGEEELSIKAPKSKPALSFAAPITQTVTASSWYYSYPSGWSDYYNDPYTESYNSDYGTSNPTSSATTSGKPRSGLDHDQSEPEDIKGVIVGIVAAMVTSIVICIIGLIFYCKSKRRKNRKREEAQKEKANLFGLVRRSASQASGDSSRPILAHRKSQLVNEKSNNTMLEEDSWKVDDSVHHPPFQHIPRNVEGDVPDLLENRASHMDKVVSPSSAEPPLPELPTRPPTVELRNSQLQRHVSIPFDLRQFASGTKPPSEQLTRPETSHGNGRYSMAPTEFNTRRSSTRTYVQGSSSGRSRSRCYSLASVGSPEKNISFATRESVPTKMGSVATADLKRQASQTSLRYSVFPKVDKGASSDGVQGRGSLGPPNTALPLPPIPTGRPSSDAPIRPGISRAGSYCSLREDAITGIPNVWNNVDHQTPKASPTHLNTELMTNESPEKVSITPRASSRRYARLQMIIPESPVTGPFTSTSISTVDTSILNSFEKPPSNEEKVLALAIPEKSSLRGKASKEIQIPSTRPSSPFDEELDEDPESPSTPTWKRRRNTGYKPARPVTHSPPPELPTALPTTAPPFALPSEIDRTSHVESSIMSRPGSGSVYSRSTFGGARSQMTMSMGGLAQNVTDTNLGQGKDFSRPYSFSTTGTASTLGVKERGVHSGWAAQFSFSPIYEAHDSITSESDIGKGSPKDHARADSDVLSPHARFDIIPQTAEEAVNSFFQRSESSPQVRTSLDTESDNEAADIESEPQLARYMSITSTSTTRRRTINHKTTGSIISSTSRRLSDGTTRNFDPRQSEICPDIDDDFSETPTRSRASSISISPSMFSVHPLVNGRPESIRANTAYSPTLSMLNFYSSSAPRYSLTPAPPNTTSNSASRLSIAARRISRSLPRISIPQPQMYIHPNTQLDITHAKDSETTSSKLAANHSGKVGSLSSATSLLSYTTADSDAQYLENLEIDMENTGLSPIHKDGISIPTPQIYSSSQEDVTAGLSRESSYVFPKRNGHLGRTPLSNLTPSFNPHLSYPHLPLTKEIHEKPSINGLLVDRSSWSRKGRSASMNTESTLDRSSFRDLEFEKKRSGSFIFSSETNSIDESTVGDESSYDGGSGFDLEVENTNRKSDLKRKRSGFIGEDRGRSRERRLV